MSTFSFSEQQCLDFVELSPQAVGAHDWPAWRDLFARYSLVEDPVGALPCVRRPGDDPERGPLARFYRTFIAPNAVSFEVHRDTVCGQHVWRDLDIHITLPSGASVVTPTHLCYELVEEAGQLRIFRLAAYWELLTTARSQSGGAGALWRMLREMGPRGVAGYMRGLGGVGDKGKGRVTALQRRLDAGQPLDDLFTGAVDAPVTLDAQAKLLSIDAFREQVREVRLSKLLAAGQYVSATAQINWRDQELHGVALFRLHPASLAVESLDFYCQPRPASE